VKITRIEINNFRGFPGPATYTFDLAGGKNLLLYGENGSGKSSLYHALDQLLADDRRKNPAFSDFANLFAKDENNQPIEGGFVTVHLDSDPSTLLTWGHDGPRPNGEIVRDAAMRKGFLEYRSLLKTNFVEGTLEERLFNLAVEVLLARIPVTLGGTPRALSEHWRRVRVPPTHHSNRLRQTASAIDVFNRAFQAVLPRVEAKATELLEYFTNHHLRLRLTADDLFYDKGTRSIKNQVLRLSVEFNGQPISGHEAILNEARLSALALALYLASVILSNPAPGPAAPSPLKLLVLDDVLIGLDLSNRLPLLDILDKHFADYQIILSTFDRVWYDLARLQTEESGKWVYAELFSRRLGNPGYDVPVLKAGRPYIQTARAHFAAHDYRAAAVYARAEFEARLKNFCEKKGLPVQYRKESRLTQSDDLWKAVIGTSGGDGACHVDDETRDKVSCLRKTVLNPLSHADESSITRAEVEAAIGVVQGLKFV